VKIGSEKKANEINKKLKIYSAINTKSHKGTW